jgi:hypothetical protein
MHDEEEHIDFLETQLDLIEKIGLERQLPAFVIKDETCKQLLKRNRSTACDATPMSRSVLLAPRGGPALPDCDPLASSLSGRISAPMRGSGRFRRPAIIFCWFPRVQSGCNERSASVRQHTERRNSRVG